MPMDWKAELVARKGPPRDPPATTCADLLLPNRRWWMMELMHHELTRLANTPVTATGVVTLSGNEEGEQK